MPEVRPPADFSRFYALYKQHDKQHMVVADLSVAISSLYDDTDVFITNNALYFPAKKRECVKTAIVLFVAPLVASFLLFLCLIIWVKKR